MSDSTQTTILETVGVEASDSSSANPADPCPDEQPWRLFDFPRLGRRGIEIG